MSKINNLIKEMSPNDVEHRKLEDCCNLLDNMRKPVKKGEREKGPYPYYGANGIQDYVSNYIFDGKFVLVGEDGSVITTSGTPIVNWAEGKIWVNNHAHVIEEIDGVMLRYLFHYIQTIDVTDLIHGNIPKLNQGDFRNLIIAVPPPGIQEEIVKILDKFGELETELETELEARKQQYDYWREKIFNRTENMIPIGSLLREKGYIRGPFGSSLVKSDMVSSGVPVYEQQHAIYNHREFRYYITEKKASKLSRFRVQSNDIIISCSGTVGKVSIINENDEKGVINQALLILRVDTNIVLPQYVKYYFESPLGYKSITSNTNKSAQVNIANRETIEKIEIPIPSIEKQKKIIEKLDIFNKLINDISEGLPAEIELRKKQYEYYRNKLLNFKEVIV